MRFHFHEALALPRFVEVPYSLGVPHEAMDIDTVAGLLSVSTRQIRTYVKAGMPVGKDGRTPVFEWPRVLDWYVGYKSSLECGERPLAGLTSLPPDGDDEDELDEIQPQQNPDDIRVIQVRRARADADLKELALSERRGEVIAIADVSTKVQRLFGNLRTQLLGMAPKLATRLVGERDPTRLESLIKDEMETLCRDLSSGAILGHTPKTFDADAIGDLQASASGGLTDLQLGRIAGTLARAYAAL